MDYDLVVWLQRLEQKLDYLIVKLAPPEVKEEEQEGSKEVSVQKQEYKPQVRK